MFIEQLIPTSDHLRRIKIKVFGSSGVGKSSLIGSMNCSYINSFFRRLSVKSSSKTTVKPQKVKDYGKNRNPLERIESATPKDQLDTMTTSTSNSLERSRSIIDDLTSTSTGGGKYSSSGGQTPLPKANILDNFEPSHVTYTRGIEITTATFHGTHHFSIWEFSGYEPYRLIYDQFIGGSEVGGEAAACIHLVAYNLTHSPNECIRECVMWLEYLRARISPDIQSPQRVSNGVEGSSSSTSMSSTQSGAGTQPNNAAAPLRPNTKGVIKVLFVATHADEAEKRDVRRGEDGRYSSEKARSVRNALATLYAHETLFDLSAEHFVLDARAAWMADIKQLIEHLIRLKQAILDSLPKSTMFLNRTLVNIQNWRKLILQSQLGGGANNNGLSNSISQTSLHSWQQQPQGSPSIPSTPSGNSLIVQSFKFGGSQISINEPSWNYPVIRWKQFIEHLREYINPLASEEHLKELIWQLEVMGECVLIRSSMSSNELGPNESDLVCFQPEWLCSRLLGRLFSHDRFQPDAPHNLAGIYRLSELRSIFSDVCADPVLLKDIFTAYHLCADIEDEASELLLEFASLNFLSEPLPLAFNLVKQYSNNTSNHMTLPNANMNNPSPTSTSSSSSALSLSCVQPTYFITNGFQIRQSDYHLERTSATKMGLTLNNSARISQLASLFFLIQVSLRSLTNCFNGDADLGRPLKSSPLKHDPANSSQANGAQPRMVKQPSLVKSHSKLDQLLRGETYSSTSPSSASNASSYPTTANSTMNILQSPSLTSTRANNHANNPHNQNNHHHSHRKHHLHLHHHHESHSDTDASSGRSSSHLFHQLHTLKMNGSLIDLELFQTRYCSRLMRKSCYIECMISLDHVSGEYIELKACAPELWREELFYFVQDLYAILECIVADVCPNLNLERHYLNFKPVRVDPTANQNGFSSVFMPDTLLSPKDIIQLELEKKRTPSSNMMSSKLGLSETRLQDIVFCGSENIEKSAVFGVDIPFTHITPYTHRMLCSYLDRVDPMGRDWSILAFLLGLQDFLPKLDMSATATGSKSDAILTEWARARSPEQATVRALLTKINDLSRLDIYELLASTIVPFWMRLSKDSGIQNSNQTLASLK